MGPAEIADVLACAPMAGRGRRLGAQGSKELVPLNDAIGRHARHRRRVLSEVMFERMAAAGLREAVLAVSESKPDIRAHFGERFVSPTGDCLSLHYVDATNSPSTPWSLAAGYSLLQDRICALGFADILYQPCPGYSRALAVLDSSGADVVLGLFPTQQVLATDMVGFHPDGRLRELRIKDPAGAAFAFTWSLAVWRPSFTTFLRDFVRDPSGNLSRELYVGDVVVAAQQAGLAVHTCVVSAWPSLDAGTPEALAEARRIEWR